MTTDNVARSGWTIALLGVTASLLAACSTAREASVASSGCSLDHNHAGCSVMADALSKPMTPELSEADRRAIENGPAKLWNPGEAGIACFDAGPIDPAVYAQVEALIRAGLPKYYLANRWTNTATNGNVGLRQPNVTITWSLVPDGTQAAPSTSNPTDPATASVTFARMDALFGNNRALWISQYQAVFDRWADLTGLSFQRVQFNGQDWDDGAVWGSGGSLGNRGDIRIGMRNIDGASNVLAFANFPNGGDVVMDSSENWSSSANSYRFFRNVLLHEVGHSLGLNHTCPTNQSGAGNRQLLEPTYSAAFDGPQQDDLRALHEFYGDASEPNDTAALAVNLGTLAPNQTATFGNVSTAQFASRYSVISTEVDFFGFTTGQPLQVTMTASPIGTTYVTGTCTTTGPAQASVNARNIGQLELIAYNAAGTTVLSTVAATALGADASATSILLPPGGGKIRVRATNSPTDSQLYTVQLSAGAPFIGSWNNNDGPVALFWNTASNVSQYRVYRATTSTRGSATLVGTVTNPPFTDLTSSPAGRYYWVETNQPGGPNVDIIGPIFAQAQLVVCGASDVAGQNQANGPDGALTADDIIVFLGWYFAGDLQADYAGSNQDPNADGELTADDIIVFLSNYFAGC